MFRNIVFLRYVSGLLAKLPKLSFESRTIQIQQELNWFVCDWRLTLLLVDFGFLKTD
jgi:hypothetical protein